MRTNDGRSSDCKTRLLWTKGKEKVSQHLRSKGREGWREEAVPGGEPGRTHGKEKGLHEACVCARTLEHTRACAPVDGGGVTKERE